MSECNCSMRQQLVGDGCHICNPEVAKDLSESGIVERLRKVQEGFPGGFCAEAADRIEELEEKVRVQLDEILSLDADKKELKARVNKIEKKCVQAVGWTVADACIHMDKGIDYRKVTMPSILERAKEDLDW